MAGQFLQALFNGLARNENLRAERERMAQANDHFLKNMGLQREQMARAQANQDRAFDAERSDVEANKNLNIFQAKAQGLLRDPQTFAPQGTDVMGQDIFAGRRIEEPNVLQYGSNRVSFVPPQERARIAAQAETDQLTARLTTERTFKDKLIADQLAAIDDDDTIPEDQKGPLKFRAKFGFNEEADMPDNYIQAGIRHLERGNVEKANKYFDLAERQERLRASVRNQWTPAETRTAAENAFWEEAGKLPPVVDPKNKMSFIPDFNSLAKNPKLNFLSRGIAQREALRTLPTTPPKRGALDDMIEGLKTSGLLAPLPQK